MGQSNLPEVLLIWGYIPEDINGNLFKLIDDFLLLWISLSLFDFFQCCLIRTSSTIISYSCLGRKHTDSIFHHSSAILRALKEMESATAWKDISKETGLIMTVTTKSFSCHILSPKLYSCNDKKLEQSLLTLVKTGKLLAHMATAVCREHYQARGAAWLICCLPIASPVLDVFCGLSPDPWAWTERKSIRYCLPVFSNYHFLPWLFFCIVGQPQWLVLLNNFRNKCRIWQLC